MSANFYLKSISFSNYRGLHGLTIPSFRRINLIGGFNGTGKSSLLEAIFFLADRRGPIALTRPYAWRKIALAGKGTISNYFADLDRSQTITINAGTASGKIALSMTYGEAPSEVSIRVPASSKLGGKDINQSMSAEFGLRVEASCDGQQEDAFFAVPMPDGLAVNVYRMGRSKIPSAAVVTPSTRNAPQEDAERFSAVVKDNKLADLLETLRVINPRLIGIQLLHENGSPILHAQFDSGTLHPIAMLGDGVQTLLSIALAIICSGGGMVLLDEFDSSIHYTALPETWSKIALLANKYNCQVFAVTHSRECIQAALNGLEQVSRSQDLQYTRLERQSSGLTSVIYTAEELRDSINADWEIR